MFKLNLKIAWRNLWKYKGYTAINIFGLSLGLASCLLIFIFVKYQLSFDKDYAHADRVYRVVSSWAYQDGNNFKSQGVPRPLPNAMKTDFGQLEKVAAVQQDGGVIKVAAQEGRAEIKSSESVFYIEPAFFDILEHEWLVGSANESLSKPFQAVLSQEQANKLFGDWKKALNKTFKFGKSSEFTVAGIIKDYPKNSSFPFNILLSYTSDPNYNSKNWGHVSSSLECYVLLKPGVQVKELDQPMAKFLKKYYTDQSTGKEGHGFQALKEVHHDGDYSNFASQISPYKELVGLSVIGVFLLITACINFVNLATAQAISRSKEVGVRKVMGSRRGQLVIQFLSETALLTVLALLLACVLAELALPRLENLLGTDASFSLFDSPIIFVFLFLLLATVTILGGIYPALVISGFSPALAIKNKVASNNVGGLGLRKILVVAQFAITGILITSTLIVIKQMSYIREKSLGFETKAIATMDLPNDSLSLLKFDQFRAQLMGQTHVKNVSFCSAAPASGNNNETNFTYDSKEADFQVNVKAADENYFHTFGLQAIVGRMLSKSDTIKEYVVNQTFLKKLNVRNPQDAIGKKMKIGGREGLVVGVVKDFNNHSLREKIAPIAFFTKKSNYHYAAIRFDTENILSTMKSVEQIFNKTFPDDVYSVEFFDEQIRNYYHTEQVMGVLFKIFAGVVIFISFIGLFGLISFVAMQRTKEIAIRKVLGATNVQLIKMLNSSFLWMVLIANLVAWPIAYIFINQWLAGFEYRIELSIWPFIIAMVTSMVITLITVTLRSYAAATANTIDVLKYE